MGNVYVDFKIEMLVCAGTTFQPLQLDGYPLCVDSRRMIQTKSMAAASNAGLEVAARTTGRVSETPVPPATASMFVTSSLDLLDEGSKPVPYGPHNMTGVITVSSGPRSLEVTVESSLKAKVFNRLVSPLRQRIMYVWCGTYG